MNFFRRMTSRIGDLARMDSRELAGAWQTLGGQNALPVPGADRPAESLVTAFACITARREAIAARAPIVSDGEDDPVENGPLYELIQSPNAGMDWGEFCRVLETHQTLHNVCAVHVEPDRFRPEIEPLHPQGLKPVLGVYGPAGTPRAMAWEYRDPFTNAQREFAPESIVIRKSYNPYMAVGALSPTRALDTTTRGELAARAQNLNLFVNDSTPRGYLSTEQGMTREQALQALDVWNGANAGFANRHKTAALWGGLKYQKLQLTPEEMEYLETLRSMRIDYYMAFRVYPAMLAEMTGETGLSQGSSTDSQRVAWWEDVGVPELAMIASLCNEAAEKIGLERAGRGRRGLGRKLYVWFNDAAIPALARQREGRVTQFAALLAAGYRPDDASQYLDLGLPPHPDNAARVAFSLQEIGAGGEEKNARLEPGGPDAERLDWAARIDAIGAAAEQAAARSDRDEGEARTRRIAALEKTAARRWSRFFVEQRGRVLARMSAIARSETLARATAETDSLAFSAFPRDEEDRMLAARLQPVIVETLRAGYAEFSARTGIELPVPLAVEDPKIQEAIRVRTIQGARVNDTTEADLRRIFERGFEAGSTVAQMGDEIAAYYRERCEGFDSDRAMNAAQTQTTGIVNDAGLLAAREVGGLKKYWIHAGPGADARPSHIRAAAEFGPGNALDLDQRFMVDGEAMLAPGDPSATPGNVCRCRCSLGYVKTGDGQ